MVTKWKHFDIDRGAGDDLGRRANGYGEDGDHYYDNNNEGGGLYGEDWSDRDWEIADRDADYWSDDEWDPDDWDHERDDRIDGRDVDYIVDADADPDRARELEDDGADAAFWQERPGRRGRSEGKPRGVWGVRAERSGNRKRRRSSGTTGTVGTAVPLRHRVETRIAAGIIGVLAAAGIVTAAVASGDDSEQAGIDPDTGLAWCVDAASDALNGAVGDGFGIEGGNACRMQSAQASTATSTGAGDPAVPSADTGAGDAVTPSTGTTVVGPPQPSGDPGAPDDTTVANADPDSTDDTAATAAPLSVTADYQSNLDLIRAQTVRNTTQDDSPYQGTPSAELVPENHYGPRSEYLNQPAGNPEHSFPVEGGGQFRAGCEFSHFAYDDPIVYPGQPGASHLHMYFGNVDANAYSTYDSIINSGSSTCNGQELNRTAYWAPAMFDGDGNVRIPERIVVYYKGEGLANGNAELFPEEAAMIASVDLNTVHPSEGGAAGKSSFVCADNYSGPSNPSSNTIPNCDGSKYANAFDGATDPRVVLEMNVKFPQCWNGQDPSNPDNFHHPNEGGWYFSQCNGEHTLVNLEYFINYPVEIGENTGDWYLSSDVNPQTLALAAEGGSTNHADWWGGWHKETNQMWLDNCVNFSTSAPSGCGFGYLTDGGPDSSNPNDGPALKYREQYTGPIKVPASELYSQLCPIGGSLPSASAAAYCTPGSAP